MYIYIYWDNIWSGWFFCAGQISSLHGPGVSQEKNNSPMRGSRWVSGLISWFSKEFGGFEHFQLELVVWNMTLFSPILPLWFSPWAPSSACETWNQRMAQNYTCTDTKLSETASTSDATYGYSSVFFFHLTKWLIIWNIWSRVNFRMFLERMTMTHWLQRKRNQSIPAPGLDAALGFATGALNIFPICEPWCWNMHTNIYPNKITQFCR